MNRDVYVVSVYGAWAEGSVVAGMGCTKGPLISTAAYTPASAAEAISAKHADAVAFDTNGAIESIQLYHRPYEQGSRSPPSSAVASVQTKASKGESP